MHIPSSSQYILVSPGEVSASSASVSIIEKASHSSFYKTFQTYGVLGKNGIGKTSEGDMKTPTGCFTFGAPFGIRPCPDCTMPYTLTDSSHYWICSPNSPLYNKFVSVNDNLAYLIDKNTDEHLSDYPISYAYCLPINYNSKCNPGAGSGIFLHCMNKNYTSGCIAIPEYDMIYVLQHLKKDSVIIIDSAEKIKYIKEKPEVLLYGRKIIHHSSDRGF